MNHFVNSHSILRMSVHQFKVLQSTFTFIPYSIIDHDFLGKETWFAIDPDGGYSGTPVTEVKPHQRVQHSPITHFLQELGRAFNEPEMIQKIKENIDAYFVEQKDLDISRYVACKLAILLIFLQMLQFF